MRYLLTTTVAFIAVVITGGTWIGLVGPLARGRPGVAVVVVGALFSVAFLWLMILRLRRLLAHPDRRALELTLLVANFAILVLTFAWVHKRVGLMDMSGGAARVSSDFGDALYFSLITITTVGYGDFIPIGSGRAIAAMQGLVGYVILGILVSTGFQLLAPSEDPGFGGGDGAGSAGDEAEDADPRGG